MKVIFLKIAHKICQNIWATFVTQFCYQEVHKIVQSGHTAVVLFLHVLQLFCLFPMFVIIEILTEGDIPNQQKNIGSSRFVL